ncbi:Uncharacterized conserved protein, DUF362 family [Caminicella sporogenes DSM 14501]|uniref:Ferredoxin n=1 Tax=Caminicella sporogenes DSM 14501 TaxID=1121266 RepID=A0A1M6MSH1_9FIRM|nr:DUF362 domain-containing protein [Caminicella sporogenes]RKD22519.1 iron-sulfur protein [Caminicella sporogenes]WIF94946.1 DUF362 domain-containing protein [Caminicella sporogenes]SHJ86475.1 Uncharacterized conserved protein, DUF362 family [Caminicella sporogenes DSM 14501]
MEKVSLIRCDEYIYEDVKESIKQSFMNLGGIDRYIKKGEKVLLKLNLLMKKKPEEATTTHPIFVRALADVLIENGAEIIIGDSPGGPFNEKILRGIYKATGMEEVAQITGAVLNYNTNSVEVINEHGKLLKKMTVIEVLKKVDKVISVSKLKTHGMVMFTGAVKNMFGIIPGLLKAEYHFKMPKIEEFSDALVDICLCGNPILSFMDGIVGMEGEGPSAGKPRKVGAVIASTSPYHLDVVATSIINIKPSNVPTIMRCIERGIVKGNLEDILLIGGKIEDFKIEDFKVPKIRSISFLKGKIPKFLERYLNNILKPKPVFHHDICIGCRDCEKSCPPKAIKMINGKPEVNLDKCIRCFCCQELCPKKAVKIHRPWILDMITKW